MWRVHQLTERIYRYYGSMITVVGMTMLVTYTIVVTFWLSHPMSIPQLYNDPRPAIIRGFLPVGFILTCSGVIIRERFSGGNQFLTKDGEPIHSGKPWKKGSESGLFLTTCGLVVSINQESRATAHVGYKIITAKRATHRECNLREGRAVLDNFAHGRAY